MLADEAGDISRGGVHQRCVRGDGDFGFYSADLQLKIDAGFLADGEKQAGADGVLETGFGDAEFVLTHGKGEKQVPAGIVRGGNSKRAGFCVLRDHGGDRNGGAGGIGDYARDAGGDLGARGRKEKKNEEKSRQDSTKQDSSVAREKHGPPLGRSKSD